MWAVKLAGCMSVILCFGLLGRKKADNYYIRVKSLESLIRFVTQTGEEIRLSENELPEILIRTIPNGISLEGEYVFFEESLCLYEEEKDIVREFISVLGMSEAAYQYKRCMAFKERLEEKRKDALSEINEKSRLFNMGGWMVGIALSFLWW